MTTSDKTQEFRESLWDTLLAAGSLLIDVLFWILWALVTSQASKIVDSLEIKETVDRLPYVVAQWSGCGTLLIFVVVKTLQDVISMLVGFWDFWCQKQEKIKSINELRR